MNQRQEKNRAKNRGQVVAEYSVLISIVVVAFIVMNIYIKRGMQARLKDASDMQMSRAAGETNFTTRQYEPEYAFRTSLSTYNAGTEEQMAPGGPSISSQAATGLTRVTEIINDTR